ncbi:MAG: aspartate/tyrosine/aromatic aminotransferase [Caldilineaceae bacterium]|nr:aspartate/tyrosine/aromatic aminotransferase [Caldilineaceae bacterium]
MFEQFTPAPPDAILGLTEAFKKDPNPRKINLGVGVYKDEAGNTPVLRTVRKAEERILQTEKTKTYLPIEGSPVYAAATQALLFGAEHEVVQSKRAATAQAPGGTGALRVAADLIHKLMPGARVWLSDPTWPNHPGIFQAAGLQIKTYPYFDAAGNGVAFDAMLAALRAIPSGDAVLLHVCCHNPTGVDLTREQWRAVADAVAERALLPILDFAYQGFANGLAEDATGLLELARPGAELLVANSYSKNFGLYAERVGALTVIAKDAQSADTMLSHVKQAIRANFSNPPVHGSAIVSTILNDPALRREWEDEVAEMRDRINAMRHLFVETLNEKGVQRDFSFIARQRGMFSFSGLTPEQVKALRDRYAIYIVGSGRISVAGMTADSMDYLCSAIADVLGN